MADVHLSMVSAMMGIVPAYGGQPTSETVSGGNAGAATLGNNQVCRVRADGDVYVRLGGATDTAASATNGFKLGTGEVIDLVGSPGDRLRVDNA